MKLYIITSYNLNITAKKRGININNYGLVFLLFVIQTRINYTVEPTLYSTILWTVTGN